MKAKYEEIAEILKSQILRSEPGTKLPSVREISQQSGVSHLTVSRAMDVLEQEGYILRRPAMGVFSTLPQKLTSLPDEPHLKRRILVLVPDEWDMDFPLLLRSVMAERGHLSVLHRYNLNGSPAGWLPRLRYDAVAFVGFCPPEMLSVLNKRQIPFVAQGVQYAHMNVDNTCGDERMVGVMAAQHLMELGHRRLAVLINEPHNPDIEERVRGFMTQSHLAGLEPTMLDCNMQWGDDGRKRAKEVLAGQIEKGGLPFTGLFAVTDTGAAAALNACYERGVCVPKHVSVIGCGDRPESAYLCPTLTTLAFDATDRAHGLVDILEKRFEGDRSPRIQRLFEPKLIRRNSTSPLQ